jgi:hypothetical protein
MNAGLFILVWECITVIVAATTKAMNPTYALTELLIQAVIVLPLAVLATYWIDIKFLSPRAPSVGRLPQMPPPDDQAPHPAPNPLAPWANPDPLRH